MVFERFVLTSPEGRITGPIGWGGPIPEPIRVSASPAETDADSKLAVLRIPPLWIAGPLPTRPEIVIAPEAPVNVTGSPEGRAPREFVMLMVYAPRGRSEGHSRTA